MIDLIFNARQLSCMSEELHVGISGFFLGTSALVECHSYDTIVWWNSLPRENPSGKSVLQCGAETD